MSEQSDRQAKENFIMPRSQYQGEFTPQNLAFNANLQEFAHRVALLCALETGGKISAIEAYNDIRKMWKELKASKKGLIKTKE